MNYQDEIQKLKKIIEVSEQLIETYNFPASVKDKYYQFKGLILISFANEHTEDKQLKETKNKENENDMLLDLIEIINLKFLNYLKNLSSYFNQEVNEEHIYEDKILKVMEKFNRLFHSVEMKNRIKDFKDQFQFINQRISEEFNSLKEKLCDMRRNIENSEIILEEFNTKNNLIQEEIKKRDEEISNLKKENSKLHKVISDLESQYKGKLYELEFQISQYEESAKNFKSLNQEKNIGNTFTLCEIENFFTKLANRYRKQYKKFCFKFEGENSAEESLRFFEYLLENRES